VKRNSRIVMTAALFAPAAQPRNEDDLARLQVAIEHEKRNREVLQSAGRWR
jgi:hypothetical protein